MSKHAFDPNKIKVEDLFQAKEDRRKELAQLPFETKIEIVNRLKTVLEGLPELNRSRKEGKRHPRQ
jgi:hypothetical protein